MPLLLLVYTLLLINLKVEENAMEDCSSLLSNCDMLYTGLGRIHIT